MQKPRTSFGSDRASFGNAGKDKDGEGNEDDAPGPVERFEEEAHTSKVTVELDDGRRHVTEKNHDTGEEKEYILPPLDESS